MKKYYILNKEQGIVYSDTESYLNNINEEYKGIKDNMEDWELLQLEDAELVTLDDAIFKEYTKEIAKLKGIIENLELNIKEAIKIIDNNK